MITKDNVEIGLKIRVASDWPSIRCSAKTRRGTACQKPPMKGKKRCRNHGGASSGPKTSKGRAKIAQTHFKHGKRSKRFVEQRKKIWAELRKIERRMKLDGLL